MLAVSHLRPQLHRPVSHLPQSYKWKKYNEAKILQNFFTEDATIQYIRGRYTINVREDLEGLGYTYRSRIMYRSAERSLNSSSRLIDWNRRGNNFHLSVIDWSSSLYEVKLASYVNPFRASYCSSYSSPWLIGWNNFCFVFSLFYHYMAYKDFAQVNDRDLRYERNGRSAVLVTLHTTAHPRSKSQFCVLVIF